MSDLNLTVENCMTLDALESALIRQVGIRVIFRSDRNTIIHDPKYASECLNYELDLEGATVGSWREWITRATGSAPVFVSPRGVIPAGHTLIKSIQFPPIGD